MSCVNRTYFIQYDGNKIGADELDWTHGIFIIKYTDYMVILILVFLLYSVSFV